jgi:hypothetical protein
MRMPGFTAEATLKVRNRVHYAAGASAGKSVDRGVLAQLQIIGDPGSRCHSWCLLNGGSPLGCFFLCGPGQLRTLALG